MLPWKASRPLPSSRSIPSGRFRRNCAKSRTPSLHGGAALEHALSIGRAWWEQCGLTLFRQGVRVSRLPLSYLRETVGVSSYEDCGLLSLSFLSNERQLDYIPPFADLLHEEALPCRRLHADLLEAQEDLCELPDAHWDEDDVSEFYCAQLGMCQACSEEMYAYGLQYGRKKEP